MLEIFKKRIGLACFFSLLIGLATPPLAAILAIQIAGVLFVFVFLVIIITGHVMAIKSNPAGLMGVYFYPKIFFKNKATDNEKNILILCFCYLFGFVISIFFLISYL